MFVLVVVIVIMFGVKVLCYQVGDKVYILWMYVIVRLDLSGEDCVDIFFGDVWIEMCYCKCLFSGILWSGLIVGELVFGY